MAELDKRLMRLMKMVTNDNTDADHRAFFMHPNDKIAYAGHRRSWGGGDMFVRYLGEIETPVGMYGPGIVTLDDNTYYANEYLLGKRLASGGRDVITEDVCNEMFDNIFNFVNGHHQLVLNPKTVLEFIKDRTRRDGLEDRVINIHPFEVVNNLGHFVAQVDELEGRLVVAYKKNGHLIPLYIDVEKSHIDTRILRIGDWVVVAPDRVVDNVRWVRVMREYQPGIRMAIQYLKNGTRMPEDPKYSIIPEEDQNTMTKYDVRDFPFYEPQDKENIKYAPMLTFQLDTFFRAMLAMAEYELVELLFKDNYNTCLISPFTYEGDPIIQTIISPISPFVLGKVVTV